MYVDGPSFALGVCVGGVIAFAMAYLAAWSITRIARLPGPTGQVYQPPMQSLPFTVMDERKEARAEAEALGYIDNPSGLGR